MYKILIIFSVIVSFINAKQLVIATGGTTGNYFKVGKDINQKVYNGKAKVINTQGSVENMLLVANGDVDIALVQADALAMLDTFFMNENKSKNDLVEVIGKIYEETVHILVSKKSNINSIEELNNKIIVSGGINSGTTLTAVSIAEEYDIKFGYIRNCSIKKGIKLLKRNKIDALFYVTKSPSTSLEKYKNFRMIEIFEKKDKNEYLKNIILPRKTYKFLDYDTQAYSVDTMLIIKKGSREKGRIQEYLETLGNEASVNEEIEIDNTVSQENSSFSIDQDTIKTFTKRYGNGALVRLNYLNKKIQLLKHETLTTQLSEINKIINKLNYSSDRKHWKKENYWATPLETLGTGCADKEDIALLKYILLMKVGLNPNNIQIIQKRDLNNKNAEIEEEDISLLYFQKPNDNPIVLDYTKTNENIYKYKNQFEYKVIKKAHNKLWDKLFSSDINNNDIDNIISILGENKTKVVTN